MENLPESLKHENNYEHENNHEYENEPGDNKILKLNNLLKKNVKKKYKPPESFNKTLSYVTPALIGFIGAYGLLIECVCNTIIYLVKDSEICKNLMKKLFLILLNLQEFKLGATYYTNNLTDSNTCKMINSSFNDLLTKLSSSFSNLYSSLIDLCQEEIEAKIEEFENVD